MSNMTHIPEPLPPPPEPGVDPTPDPPIIVERAVLFDVLVHLKEASRVLGYVEDNAPPTRGEPGVILAAGAALLNVDTAGRVIAELLGADACTFGEAPPHPRPTRRASNMVARALVGPRPRLVEELAEVVVARTPDEVVAALEAPPISLAMEQRGPLDGPLAAGSLGWRPMVVPPGDDDPFADPHDGDSDAFDCVDTGPIE